MLGKISVKDLHGPLTDFMDKLQGQDDEEWFAGFKRFLRKENPWPITLPDTSLDPVIRVDRRAALKYPDWMRKVMHPELQELGPAEYSVECLRPDKETGSMTGHMIYEGLVANDQLSTCLGLVDLLAIQAKGIDFYRKHFKGEVVPGWKSVVMNQNSSLHMPYLCAAQHKVALGWFWLQCDYNKGPVIRLHV